MAGSGDDAESKERFFDDYLGVPVFDPRDPKVGKKGVRIASLQHFPDAMRAVFRKIDEKPEFEAAGDLSLKLWISDSFLPLPRDLDIPVVRALAPYDKKLMEINRFVGANFLRQNMRNKSGASRMDPKTQVAELHGQPVLDLSRHSVEENVYFALGKLWPPKSSVKTLNLVLNLLCRMLPYRIEWIREARANGCTPNAFLASVVAMLGDNPMHRKVRAHSHFLIEQIREYGIEEHTEKIPDALSKALVKELFQKDPASADAEVVAALEREFETNTLLSPVVPLVRHIRGVGAAKATHLKEPVEFYLAAILVSIFWKPMLEKRITRDVVENAVAYLDAIACMSGYAVTDPDSNAFWKGLANAPTDNGHASFTETLFRILFNREPTETERTEFQYLIGLTVTNGPGTLSAKGAKESVSARNAIATAFSGFMTNTGLAHGGNGFEAVEYLLEQFAHTGLQDPGTRDETVDLKGLANQAAKQYFKYKQAQREAENPAYKRIPCINHPVFKGKDVNIDPREDFVRKELENRGSFNAFLEFYHHLVRELFNEGATENVFCVNVDAVLACVALKLIWADLRGKRMTVHQAKDLVFILFLLGRAIGVAAEIADHRDRGEDMDCRTPQNEVSFVL
jgi:citrate synthase